jgi:hypothetical protein
MTPEFSHGCQPEFSTCSIAKAQVAPKVKGRSGLFGAFA